MSLDNVGGTTILLDNQVLPYVDMPDLASGQGPSLVSALALVSAASAENNAVLQPDADTLVLDDGGEPFFAPFEPDMPVDEGGGSIEVYEPSIYVPEGFVADDLYAIEFILNQSTGELTINLHFSTDPLDHQLGMGASLDSGDILTLDPGLGGISPEQGAPANGSRCTVTITKTTTHTNPTSSVTLLGGLINFTYGSGGQSETTTQTIQVEGKMINGRCVVSGDKK
ncbi:MAG TPA: hypothetical protein VF548_12170 [Allosphingosinicella sp.]|jgi:hypothetical protein